MKLSPQAEAFLAAYNSLCRIHGMLFVPYLDVETGIRCLDEMDKAEPARALGCICDDTGHPIPGNDVTISLTGAGIGGQQAVMQ